MATSDGIVPVAGFYGIRTTNPKINQFYINGDIQARSNDNGLFHNVDILSEYEADYMFGNVKQIYNEYNNFHGVHQSLAENKAGSFKGYTLAGGKGRGVKEGGSEEICNTFEKAFYHFQQKNINKMISGGFLIKVELDTGFLNKTCLTPFVIEKAIVEFNSPCKRSQLYRKSYQ